MYNKKNYGSCAEKSFFNIDLLSLTNKLKYRLSIECETLQYTHTYIVYTKLILININIYYRSFWVKET